MNDTIQVPRELLERLIVGYEAHHYDTPPFCEQRKIADADLRAVEALLSPAPVGTGAAGVKQP